MASRILRAAGMAVWHSRVAFMYAAAFVWRRLLLRTTFIAITGSMGKTTAKECLAGILGARYRTACSVANQNDYSGVPRSLLRVRPWHRVAVIEVAANGLGLMRRSARLVRPDIAIILLVARNHMKNFRTLENVAAEKATLLARLRPQGIALLNGDDPRVAAMARPVRQRLVWFGSSPAFDYCAEAASSSWPQRFSFQLHAGPERRTVHTRLVGTHWKNSVLAAIAAANLCGVSLDDAIAEVARIEPAPARLQPVRLPCGAVIIRDELDGSIGALAKAFDVFASAAAERRILVLSGVTDTSRGPRDRYRTIGRSIAGAFDIAVFIGNAANHGVRGAVAAGMKPENVHGFVSLWDAREFLAKELRRGDLVLLRGRLVDHLSRLSFALTGPIACHRAHCEKRIICDLCPELGAVTPLQPETAPLTHIAAVPQ
jgi:UDP-N-acetylmuramoyl-tripeptide--D-alanyl-D-alanine ligase